MLSYASIRWWQDVPRLLGSPMLSLRSRDSVLWREEVAEPVGLRPLEDTSWWSRSLSAFSDTISFCNTRQWEHLQCESCCVLQYPVIWTAQSAAYISLLPGRPVQQNTICTSMRSLWHYITREIFLDDPSAIYKLNSHMYMWHGATMHSTPLSHIQAHSVLVFILVRSELHLYARWMLTRPRKSCWYPSHHIQPVSIRMYSTVGWRCQLIKHRYFLIYIPRL